MSKKENAYIGYGIATQAIHTGTHYDEGTGAVRHPLHMANSSPFNAWQIFRGSVTFPLRMQRINESSQIIAVWLEKQPFVTFVSYPGLVSNPSHELAKRQMKNGYGGVISFGVNTDDKTVEHFCAALKVVTFAVSLGHDESLIFPQPSYDERINLYPKIFRKGFIRFSVGLEEPEDIIGDLEQAFHKVGLF